MAAHSLVYLVNIDGSLQRHVAKNPYILIAAVKEEIRTEHNLPYDFDLFYNGQQVLNNTSLIENRFKEDIPLCVERKKIKPPMSEFSNRQSLESTNSTGFSARISRAKNACRRAFENLLDEIIKDKPESENKTSTQSADKYQCNRTSQIHPPSLMTTDQQDCMKSSSIIVSNPLTARSQLSSLDEALNKSNVQPVESASSTSCLTTMQITCPDNVLVTTNSTPKSQCSIVSRPKTAVCSKKIQQVWSQDAEKSTSLLKTNNVNDIKLVEVEGNLPKRGNAVPNSHR